MRASFFCIAALAVTVAAHGYVDFPPAREVGPASLAACGRAVTDDIRKDNTSHVEGLPELAAGDSGYHADKCNLWLCRGLQFGDNSANIQKYKAGEVVHMKIKLTIPHDGSANVSIVNTNSNKIIGDMLKYWKSGYANERQFYAKTLPANNTDFNVTLPDVSAQCAEPGACILQWWWYGVGARQTYESCVDFTMTPVQ
ncbi:hypothetical protein NKR23_g3555 [Pleurostoma richardsiae]|uniref:Chitin-binding type-4 domain-containing protein n=1 Tax=Pleurostoma richardsiae TaxID=41990 RepID=A0AA38S7D9_9PEZI|nr:hypothetical protein NKR23_g3555 [Pleurostoma richardsiae]